MLMFLFKCVSPQWHKSIKSGVFNLTEGSSFLRCFILWVFFSARTNYEN